MLATAEQNEMTGFCDAELEATDNNITIVLIVICGNRTATAAIIGVSLRDLGPLTASQFNRLFNVGYNLTLN